MGLCKKPPAIAAGGFFMPECYEAKLLSGMYHFIVN